MYRQREKKVIWDKILNRYFLNRKTEAPTVNENKNIVCKETKRKIYSFS